MKINAIENYRLNNIQFESNKNKGIQKPVHSSNPIKAIPVAVLVAMSPLNAPETHAIPLPLQTEITSSVRQKTSRPASFIESKEFHSGHNDCLVGVVKDKQSGNYRLWLESIPKDRTEIDIYGLNGYITELNNNRYRITDELGIGAATVKFRNIYILDSNGNEERDDGIVNPEVCNYVEEMMEKYQTDIKKYDNKYTSTLTTIGSMKRLEFADIKWFNIARENPMYFGTPMKTWDIETSNGNYKVKIYDNDKNTSNFETVTIQKENGPELKADEIVANNTYIYSQGDKTAMAEMYQINVSHTKAGKHALVNKELWEFLYQVMSTKQCNNAMGARQADIYHMNMLPHGIIGEENY